MEMYPPPGTNPPPFEPSAEQLARERELRRFNRLAVYLPLGLLALAGIVVVVLLLIGVFSPNITGTEAFISALADIIIILWIMPMLVLMALLIIGYVAWRLNRRQQRKLLPPDSLQLRYGRLQPLLWRAQSLLNRASVQVDQKADMVTNQVIRSKGRVAYVDAWVDILTRPFRRNDERDAD